jgi:CheY-like chemotaxis protein
MLRRILIVEDHKDWLTELRVLYKTLLDDDRCEVAFDEAHTKEEALSKLRQAVRQRRLYDLLSLDINLGVLEGSDGRTLADGRDVLKEAHKLRVCFAVAIVTGIHGDQEIEQYYTGDAGQRVQMRAALPSILNSLFPNGRGLYIPKDLAASARENVTEYLRPEIAGMIKYICRPRDEFCKHGKSWKITFAGQESSIKEDRSGALRALALMLQSPFRSFTYEELFPGAPVKLTEAQEAAVKGVQSGIDDQLLGTTTDNLGLGASGQPNNDARAIREYKAALGQLYEEKEAVEDQLERLNEVSLNDPDYEKLIEHLPSLHQRLTELTQQIQAIEETGVKMRGERLIAFRNKPRSPHARLEDTHKKALRRCINNLKGNHHAALGEHLKQSIIYEAANSNQRLSASAVYRPQQEMAWFVQLESTI